MTQHDRMETITDPAAIRATDEPDPFRRNPVRRTGPDDPWRFTRFVADDHECVIVRDEYDEPAPFGSCSTHRRALSSPVALGCTTPAPVGAAAALDLDAIEARQKAAASARWEIIGDRDGPRALMALLGEDVPALVAEVRRVTEVNERLKRGGTELGRILDRALTMALDASGCHDVIEKDGDGDWEVVWETLAGLRPRAEAAEAEVVTLRARLAALQVVVSHSAESCADGPCEFHETVARAESAEAKVAAVEAVAEEWDHREYVRMPEDFAATIRAALATGEGQHVAREVFTAEGIPFVSCSCTSAKSPTSSRWLAEHVPNGGVAELQAVVKRQADQA